MIRRLGQEGLGGRVEGLEAGVERRVGDDAVKFFLDVGIDVGRPHLALQAVDGQGAAVDSSASALISTMVTLSSGLRLASTEPMTPAPQPKSSSDPCMAGRLASSIWLPRSSSDALNTPGSASTVSSVSPALH